MKTFMVEVAFKSFIKGMHCELVSTSIKHQERSNKSRQGLQRNLVSTMSKYSILYSILHECFFFVTSTVSN